MSNRKKVTKAKVEPNLIVKAQLKKIGANRELRRANRRTTTKIGKLVRGEK
jgi:hypothetical protein